MLGKHTYDPAFRNCSGGLKNALSVLESTPFEYCLDMPCGNGRNTFLLATYFNRVVGIDINDTYLNEIKDLNSRYGEIPGSVSTTKMDLTIDIPEDTDQFDFITNIHYYNYSLISRVIDIMKKGAYFYIETPGCAGENYKELPTEEEVKFLLQKTELVMYKFRPCLSSPLNNKSISFKALIRKTK